MSRSVRRLRRCLLPALALLLFACASREQRFTEHVKRGERHAAEGRIDEAVLEYQSALELDPRDADLCQRVGDLLASRREYKDAISYYRQAFELDPARLGAAMSEAHLLAFNDPKRALDLVRLGLERAPDRVDVQLTRAHVALASNDVEEALLAAERAAVLDPASSASWAQLGKVQQARIRKHQLAGTLAPPEVFQAALDAYARVDQIGNGDVRAQVERARVFAVWEGHRDEALAAHRAALAVAKQRDDTEGRLLAARALEAFAKQLHDNATRLEALREIVEAEPADYEAWDQLARLSGAPRGEAICRELIAKRPDDPRAHRVYASYLQRKRRPADAIAHLRNTLAAGLRSPLLWQEIVSIQIRANQLADARATYVELADAFPDDPITRDAEAQVAVAEGRFSDAAAILRELVKSRDNASIQRRLAVSEQQLGNLPAALAAIDRAIALAPDTFELYRLKASIHHDAKQWGKVIVSYRALAGRGRKLTPADEVRRARALYEFGRPDAGRAVLAQVLAQASPPVDAVVEFARREGGSSFEVAQQALLAALARAPGDLRLLGALAQLEIAAGRSELALEHVDAEIKAGRATPNLLLLRARLFVSRGQLAKAEAAVLRAFAAEPTLPGAAELLFDIYRRQGKLAEAQRSFEQAESAGLLHAGTRLLLARLQLSQGELAKAQQGLEKVVVEQPELASARNDLAFVLAQRGEQLERALELARGAQQALGESPEAIDTLGYIHYRAGRHAEALAELQRAIAIAGSRATGVAPSYTYHLGLVLQALGRQDEAASAFQRALDSAEDFPEAEDARRRLESVLAKSPPDANPS